MNVLNLDGNQNGDPLDMARMNFAMLGPRLKLARQIRGQTLKSVSRDANCSESLLSKIENGKASPSLPMLHKLVEALGVNIGWMFEEPNGDEENVFRAGSRPIIAPDPLHQGEGISLERIIPYSSGHLLQCNIHHIESGGKSAGPIQHVGEEVGYILEGEIFLTIGDKTMQLVAGDAFIFSSELPHHYQNSGDNRASIFWVNTPATF